MSHWTGLVGSGNGGVAEAMSVGGDYAVSCDWVGGSCQDSRPPSSGAVILVGVHALCKYVEEWLSHQPNLTSPAHCA